MDVLRSNQHNGFPVTHFNADGEAYIMGVVLRQHLLVVLASRRACQPSPFVTEVGTEGERGVQGSGGEGAVGQHQPPTFHTAIKPPIRPCGPACCQGNQTTHQALWACLLPRQLGLLPKGTRKPNHGRTVARQ